MEGISLRSGSLYYASDKALFDALNQHKFTKQNIQKLFFRRGMIVSNVTEKERLSEHFCRLTHDYHDHQTISSIFNSSSKREKISIISIENKIDEDKIEEVLESLQEEIEENEGVMVVSNIEEGFSINLKYRIIDYNKSEFKQVSDKTAHITIEQEGDNWTIRGPQNNFVDDNIKDKFLDKIGEELSDDLNISEINLTGVVSPKKRTEFFKKLINNIDGYTLVNVSDVYVFHPREDEEMDEETESEDNPDLGIHIKKASLKGEKVLLSEELQSLYEKDFYISKVIWTIESTNNPTDIYELEAQFSNPENCTGFSYLIRGFYKYQSEGDYHNKSKINVSAEEEKKFSKLLENAAEKALVEVSKESDEIEG